jgi:hypothetical protein
MTAVFGNRTPEQIAVALEKARDARRIRSRLLARIRTGDLTLPEVLSAEDHDIERLPVRTVLRALPGVGIARTADVMLALGIPETRRIGGLGHVQREKLLAWRAASGR